jgi:Flp pilus assembly protein TadB
MTPFTITPVSISVAVLVGLGIVGLLRFIISPDRRLAGRMNHFVRLPVAQLGGVVTGSAREAGATGPSGLREWLRISSTRPARLLSTVMDNGDDDTIRMLMRHAGRTELTTDSYRWHQFARAGVGGVVGLVLGAGVGSDRNATVPLAMIGAVGGMALGASTWRGSLRDQADKRTALIGLEVYAVAHLLAMLARANHGPLAAVRRVVARGEGPLIEELERVLASIAGGARPDQAFDRGASEMAHPGATRLFRLIGQSATTGGDLAPALRALSDQLRTERRTDLEQAAIKKRGAMIIPTLVLMLPVVMVYIIAPVSSVFFGGG